MHQERQQFVQSQTDGIQTRSTEQAECRTRRNVADTIQFLHGALTVKVLESQTSVGKRLKQL